MLIYSNRPPLLCFTTTHWQCSILSSAVLEPLLVRYPQPQVEPFWVNHDMGDSPTDSYKQTRVLELRIFQNTYHEGKGGRPNTD